MRNVFDQLAKKIGKEALDTCGVTVAQREVSRDAQHADLLHEPDPTRDAERARLGLLGRLAAVLCFIEIYGHAPDGAEIRACLAKHFAHWVERRRRARAQNKRRGERGLPPAPFTEPFLWIIAATVSAPMLRKLSVEAAPSFPKGVYLFGEDLFRAGIVVANELPHERSTLLVRMMAAGPRLSRAVMELEALPADAEERAVATGILIHLWSALRRKSSLSEEEEELIVKLQETGAKAQEKWRKLGRVEEAARNLLAVLEVRKLAVSESVREHILAQKSAARLERWHKRAIVAASIDDVIDDPS